MKSPVVRIVIILVLVLAVLLGCDLLFPDIDNGGDKAPDKPVIELSSGTYPWFYLVIISSTTAKAKIYYTSNSSTPTKSFSLYTEPVPIASKIRAYTKLNGVDSKVVSESYDLIDPDLSDDIPAPTTAVVAEAPSLAVQVAAGQIPSVQDRMPSEPLLESDGSTGKYGGMLRSAWEGVDGQKSIYPFLREKLIRFNSDGTAIVPNIATSWTVNADESEFTFAIREGLKWSDGVSFTADDVLFYWDELIVNNPFNGSIPGYLNQNGDLPVVQKIDDYTFKISYPNPYPTFPIGFVLDREFYAPRHYLMQFLSDPQTLEEKTITPFLDTDTPSLGAWITTEYDSSGLITMKRNAYYFKVDSSGNQLPYIDTFKCNYSAV